MEGVAWDDYFQRYENQALTFGYFSDPTHPHLLPSIVGLIIHPEGTKGTVVFAKVRIENSGASSIAQNFKLAFRLKGVDHNSILVEMPEELSVSTNPPLRFHRSDALYEKVMNTPIAPGAGVDGWLIFLFDSAQLDVADFDKGQFVFWLWDVNRDASETELAVKDFGIKPPEYVPGSALPIDTSRLVPTAAPSKKKPGGYL